MSEKSVERYLCDISLNVANVAITEIELEKILVARVIDGDTIELESGDRVRLIGVDCPECGEDGFEEATQFTRNSVEGKTVWLESDGNDTDGFGRLRRYVWIQPPTDLKSEEQAKNKMLNAQLLINRYANVAIIGDVRLEALFRKLACCA